MSIQPSVPIELLKTDLPIATPAIIYDIPSIKHIINTIKKDISIIPNSQLLFSVKANRNAGLLSELARLGIGADVASLEEYAVAKQVGMNPIHATSPSLCMEEIGYLNREGVVFDYNSLSQLKASILTDSTAKRIGLRVKLNIEAEESNKDITFGVNSRFGIDPYSEELTDLLMKTGTKVVTIHVHMGEMFNAHVMKQVMDQLESIVCRFPDLATLNLGGGLTYLYSDREEAIHTWEVVSHSIKRMNDLSHKNIHVLIEPGMLLSAMCGYLLTSVRSSDLVHGYRLVTLDSSAWNLMYWTPPVLVHTYTKNTVQEIHKLSGSTCYEQDVFIESTVSNRLEIGDKVLLGPAGAYVVSMARQMHGAKTPCEWLLIDGEFRRSEEEQSGN